MPEPQTRGKASSSNALLAVICLSCFMVILDNSIIFTGPPKIQASMHFSPSSLAWVTDAYVLVFGGLLLLGARAGDLLGWRKVFIASLWRDPAFHDLPLAEFKQRLLDAHHAGTVTLARADLVAAMDPELVRESETPHQDTRYHFVERGGAP